MTRLARPTSPAGRSLYTFTFSQPVNGFAVADVVVVGGTKAAAFASGADGSSVYTLVITPNAGFQGNLTVDVAAGVATDLAGNPNTAAPQSVQAVDTLAPSVVITDDEAGTANIAGGTILYTFTFSQPVNGFAVADVVVVGGTKAAAFASGADGSSVYTLVITPNAGFQGNLTVDVAAGVATDLAGNPNTAAPQSVQAVDTLAPSVVITDDEAGTANIAGGTILYTFTFSQPVNGFAVADVVVVGGTKAAAFASGADGSSVYTLVITPNAGFQGNLTVDVAAGVATDLAGNPNTAAVQSMQAVDTLRPDATIVVADTNLLVGETSLVTFTFTEAVTGFTNADLTTIEGGTLSTVSSANGGITWTATFTPTANIQDATNVITLNDTGVTDLAGNAGVGTSVSNNYAIDTLGPSVTVNIQRASLSDSNPTSLVTFSFSSAPTGFTAADVTVTGGTLSAITQIGNSPNYRATFTATDNFVGTGSVSVTAGSYTDAAGHPGGAGSDTVAINLGNPTVTITDDEAGTATIAGGSILYTFQFSETVTGFDAADITVDSGTKGAFTPVDGDTYTLVVTPDAGFQGNLIVGVAAGVATDLAGTPNTAALSVQAVDTLAPSVVITDDEAGTANIAGGTILYTFTFSQPVNGFAVADVVVTGGTKAAAFASGVDGSSVYTLVITPNAGFQGNLTVDVAAGVATDLAGNPNTAAPQSVQAVDTLAPSVVITDDEAGTANIAGGTILYTFTFSQSVNGFAVDDVVVVGGTKAAAFASGVDGSSVYTLVITPNAGFQGNLTVDVAAGVAADLAGNPNTAAPQSVQPVDTLAPVASITLNAITADNVVNAAEGVSSQRGDHRHGWRRRQGRRHGDRDGRRRRLHRAGAG